MELWTAFLIGMGGSFHCAGMCGPLALALPGGEEKGWRLLAGRLLYNAGRVLTYALVGGLSGLVGGMVRMAGLQQALSLLLGAAIVLAGLGLLLPVRRLSLPGISFLWTTASFRKALSALFQSGAPSSLLLIGLLNGLLPCGFVYLGLAGSLATGSAAGGMAYMALFGLGTAPLMLAVSLSGHLVRLRARRWMRRAAPVGMLLLGGLFVLRGPLP